MRAIFFDADDAERVASRLREDGYDASVVRDRFAGEDDDEDHGWAVQCEAPAFAIEVLAEEYEGWVDHGEPTPAAGMRTPAPLPTAPRRVKRPASEPVREGQGQQDGGVLLVHAHPDDESINNGATMAAYAAAGVPVTLVTCTAGEQGEVIPEELRHLEGDPGLGPHRRDELAAAMRAIGVSDHRWLGGFGRYRDSGMQWHPDGHAVAADHVGEGAFFHADLLEAANLLVPVIREVRPAVLITYDEFGGYGHPDHIQAHRVATYAAHLAGVAGHRDDLGPAYRIPTILWTAVGERRAAAQVRIDARPHLGAQLAALAAHATQLVVTGEEFALSNGSRTTVEGVEYYQIAQGSAPADALF